jgi:hypothetical protein
VRSLLISSHHRPLLVSQLAQVEAAIAQDPGNREWTTLRNDLLEVIELTGELGQIKSTENAPAREVELRTYSVGEKCQAIFEMDGSWYNAKIVALAEDGYFVTFLGYGNTAQVEFNEVRPYQRPDTSLFKPGEEVSAVHSDARWYDAVLNEVKGNVAFVTFKGETEPAEVDLDFVRPKSVSVERKRKQCGSPRSPPPPCLQCAVRGWPSPRFPRLRRSHSPLLRAQGRGGAGDCCQQGAPAVAASGLPDSRVCCLMEGGRPRPEAGRQPGAWPRSPMRPPSSRAQLPKNLEARPDDSEDTALKKKKKLNMYKRQEKKDKEEKQGEGRRTSWQSFAKKNKTTKAAKNGHDPRWDPTRDHGELAARQQMEKYSTYLAREGGS